MVELVVSVGSIRLEVEDADVKEQVHEICEKILPFPFEFREEISCFEGRPSLAMRGSALIRTPFWWGSLTLKAS